MSSERDRPTLADYIILALNPALVMVLVGSLVFFLVEVLYAGAFVERMRWMLFFFVFAAVLISRISLMGEIAGRSGIYGLVLGILVWFGLQSYVEYPPDSPAQGLRGLINLGLILLVWWCAHRLTKDCTHVDEDADPGNEGLLQAAGFESGPGSGPQEEKEEEPTGWWERYKRYRQRRKKKRTPGVWVVWFSLAALPIFGLGQSLIPVQDVGRRQFVFWLMSLYLAGGLGLLLTTTFLGVRRYLRQRKVSMPPALTMAWLSLGACMIVALLLAGAFLPRPQAEYPLIDFRAMSKPADASEHAQVGGEAGEGEGRPQGEPRKDGKDGGNGQEKGQDQDKGANGQDKGKDKEASSSEDKDGKQAGERGSGSGKSDGSGKGSQRDRGGRSSRSRSLSSNLLAPLGRLATVLKWIVFGVLALLVLIVLLRSGLQFLANFTSWARQLLEALRNFWASLFGGRQAEAAAEQEASEKEEKAEQVRPFSWYRNPFDTGAAEGMSAAELLGYTFAALEAWARERGLSRFLDETALEFAGRLGEEIPALAAELRRLALLYGRVMYAPGGLPANWREGVRQFWQELEMVAEQSLSAGGVS